MPNLIEIFFSECVFVYWIIFNLDLIICNTSLFYDWFLQRLHILLEFRLIFFDYAEHILKIKWKYKKYNNI